MNIDIKTTEVFEWNWEVLDICQGGENYNDLDDFEKMNARYRYRYIFNRGSSRSSKTYSILQLIIVKCLSESNISFDILRKTLTALRGSVMKDFFDILKDLNIYKRKNHNKTENIYTFENGSEVHFYGADNEQKLRGRKRTYCYINECNELYYDDVIQITLRLERQLFADYNPSESSSWVYEFEARQNAKMFHSTFQNNSFLTDEQISEILSLKDKDPEKWAIFGLGLRSMSLTNVYNHFKFVDDKPHHFKEYNYIYGLDWGYNDPTAIVKVYFHEDEIYIEEILYESYLTVNDIVEFLNNNNIDKNKEIIVDYARPENSSVLIQNGYNCQNANKRIKAGIDALKSKTVYINRNSKYLIKEYENYKWKKRGDTILDEPIDLYNHALDALRYANYHIDLTKKASNETRFTMRRF